MTPFGIRAPMSKNFLGLFLHCLKLKSYEFNIYKSKKEKKIVSITIFGKKKNAALKNELKFLGNRQFQQVLLLLL